MAAQPAGLDFCGFTLIVDDTVHPDGTTSMEQVGGGGPQTLWGYQLQRRGAARVGLAAGVGKDLPKSVERWLSSTVGCDLSGLIASDTLPTPRAWQVMEHDGRRTQVWRSRECDALYGQLRPSFSELPPSFQAASTYHLGIHAAFPPMKLLRSLRDAAHAQGGLLSLETYTSCDAPLLPSRRAELAALMAACDVFSPNEGEAASILGAGPALDAAAAEGPQQHEAAAVDLVNALIDLGATTVLLRRGADGVLAAHGPSGQAVSVPAVPGTVVRDVVGCGNACCGAFLAAYTRGASLAKSAAWGCAAGSVMAEHRGVPRDPIESLHPDAARRQAEVLRLARPVALRGGARRGLRVEAAAAAAAAAAARAARLQGIISLAYVSGQIGPQGAMGKQQEGLTWVFQQKVEQLELLVKERTHNLRRLEAQRNELNTQVRQLREELQLLQEPGSYVGEVIKVMGKSKVLVKVHPEGKYVVDLDKSIDAGKLTPGARVALRSDSYTLHILLPTKVDPLVSLMKVEKVPDSTYDMIGGLDQQIKEIKE
ncbi:26S proteasome regulatory subunit T6, partial [Monoraphidium neglectum]